MKILKSDIDKIISALRKFNFPNEKEKVKLFFPIDTETDTEQESNGLITLTEKENKGYCKLINPGLLYEYTSDGPVIYLAYALLEYQFKMRLREYVSLYDPKMRLNNRVLEDTLYKYEALLVNEDNILAKFEL